MAKNYQGYKQLTSGSFVIKYTVILIVILLLFFLPEHVFKDGQYGLCLHRKILGFRCPLCGMTRAAYEILHLNISTAIRLNFAILFLPIYFLLDVAAALTRQPLCLRLRNLVMILFFLSLFLIYVTGFLHFRASEITPGLSIVSIIRHISPLAFISRYLLIRLTVRF